MHVEETALAGTPFTRVGIERDEDDWLHCSVGPPDRTVVAFKPKPSELLAVREPDRVG